VRNLLKRKLRTVLTVLGVVIGFHCCYDFHRHRHE
jgi:hypothetical protein